ncbi:MAG: energy transducer TonB [Pyrinomonadaceae bacterium]
MKFVIAIVFLSFSVFNCVAQIAPSKAGTEQTTPTPSPAKIISGGVLNGKAIDLPKPTYPEAARAEKIGGSVRIKVIIDEVGNVADASVLSGDILFAKSALQAARLARFSPTLLSGQPVKVSGVLEYNFVPESSGIVPWSDRDKVWALGVLIAVFRSENSELIDYVLSEDDGDNFAKDLASEIPPELISEKALFDELKSANKKEQPAAVYKILLAAKKTLEPEQKWQTEVGEKIGDSVLEFVRVFELVKSGNDSVDTSKLAAHLKQINDLLPATPKTTPQNTVSMFKSFAAFSNAPNLGSATKLNELWVEFEKMFKVLDDDK